jgi:hypothetical protein
MDLKPYSKIIITQSMYHHILFIPKICLFFRLSLMILMSSSQIKFMSSFFLECIFMNNEYFRAHLVLFKNCILAHYGL